jgi:cytochrome P450
VSNIYGPNIVATEGPEWKRHRELANPAFSDANIRLVADATARLSNNLCTLWKNKLSNYNSITVSVDPFMRDITMGVISEAGFGVKIENVLEEDIVRSNEEFSLKFFKVETTMSFRSALSIVSTNLVTKLAVPPFMYNLPIRHLQKVKEAFEVFENTLTRMIQERQADPKAVENAGT